MSAPYTSRAAPVRAPVGPAGLPFPSVERFGTGVQGIFLNYSEYTPQEIESQLRALRATGSTVARSDALWEAAELDAPVDGKHDYHWEFDDLTAGTLAAIGVRWIPIVDYSPPWAASAAGQSHSPPRGAADFASFAAALPSGMAPEAPFGAGGPISRGSGGHLGDLERARRRAVLGPGSRRGALCRSAFTRSGRDQDCGSPGARDRRGLTDPASFLTAMIAARPALRGHVDGVAIHPWGPNPVAVLRKVHIARAKMTLLGMESVLLYVTAFGWTIRPRGAVSYLPAHLRPAFIAETTGALGHTDCGIAAVILNTWVTPQRNPLDGNDWFGIQRPSGGRSPDATAFAAGLHTANQHRPQLRLC